MAADSEEVHSEFLRLGARLKATWWVEDVSSQFRWLRKRRIIWLMSRPAKKVVAMTALAEAKPALVLTGENGIATLSKLFQEEIGTLPGDLTAAELARAIRWLTTGVPGKLLSPEVLERTPPIEAFVPSGREPTLRFFREQCAKPTLERDPGDAWRLRFRYLALDGSVEDWTVEGSASEIRSAQVTTVAVPGTFRWPYE